MADKPAPKIVKLDTWDDIIAKAKAAAQNPVERTPEQQASIDDALSKLRGTPGFVEIRIPAEEN